MATKEITTGSYDDLLMEDGNIFPLALIGGPNKTKCDSVASSRLSLRQQCVLPLPLPGREDFICIDDRDVHCHLPEPTEEVFVGTAPPPIATYHTDEAQLWESWRCSRAFEELYGVAHFENFGGGSTAVTIEASRIGGHLIPGGTLTIQADLEMYSSQVILVGEAKTFSGLKSKRSCARRQPFLATLAAQQRVKEMVADGHDEFDGVAIVSVLFLIHDAWTADLIYFQPLDSTEAACDRTTEFVPIRSLRLNRPRS